MISENKVNISQACRVADIDRKTYRYKPKKLIDDEEIKSELLSFSAKYPQYGFKKIFDMMKLQSKPWNHKRVYRIYCELKLNLKVKPKKRLAKRTAIKLEQPMMLNECWSFDFMSDSLVTGRRFRTANVIDDCNREALGILVDYSLPALKVTRWLDHIALIRGYPKKIRVDNGPENISRHFAEWAKNHDVVIHYIQPGKPAQNGYVERFNRSYREAVLDMYLFENIQQVQKITNEWLQHYNEERPHDALGSLTPLAYARQVRQELSICEVG